ncbi:MAG: Gfo/Idh/MocA family protein [Polymorphobacter sp.]
MTTPIRLALIGIGKIARDQHLPAIAADVGFDLVAAVSRNARVEGVAHYPDIAALRASGLAIDAVSIATPPVRRHEIASAALAAGWHVMLEKPPGATLAEVRGLRPGGLTLFASWHSRAAAGVATAKVWLADRSVTRVSIVWREDIRVWHPGQGWILAAGGMGVFDPGINALSIVTEILPLPLRVTAAHLVVPAGRGAPIAATLAMAHGTAPVTADLDFRQTGPQSWDISVETSDGVLLLRDGGKSVLIDDVPQPLVDSGEYPALYRRFVGLIAARRSDCDLAPLELVADAFMLATRESAPAFDF